jgi:hypothetical protein
LKSYIIFYTDYQLFVNNKICGAFDYFEYDKKYEVIESYDTGEWDKYHRKVSLGNGEYIIIYYYYDRKSLLNFLDIQDGQLVEYSIFPSYDFIEVDIQEERDKKLDNLLK